MAFLNYKTNLLAWHEADLTVMQSDGSLAPPYWTDETGTGNQSLQTFGAPVFKYSQINGRPVVQLDGANDYWQSTSVLSTYMTASAGTLFVVFKCTACATDNVVIPANVGLFGTGAVITGTGSRYMGLYLRNIGGVTPTLYAYGFDTAAVSVSVPFVLNQWGIAWWQHGGNVLTVGYNDDLAIPAQQATLAALA